VLVEAEIDIPAEPRAVWDLLADWEGQADWMGDVDRIRVLTERRAGPGVRLEARTRVLGVPLFSDVIEVTAWEPPRRLEVSHVGLVRGAGRWSLEAVEGGTRFRWEEDVRLGLPGIGELALIAYRPVMRRLMRGSLRRLRARASS
jgi:uncharacterized protein YndB with AHSA1/START domain